MTTTPHINIEVSNYRGDGTMPLYYFETTKSGKFAVRARYTGLPTGAIGSGGKSFATETERSSALEVSCELIHRVRGWTLIRSCTTCGHYFAPELGKYGCPNCEGANVA